MVTTARRSRSCLLLLLDCGVYRRSLLLLRLLFLGLAAMVGFYQTGVLDIVIRHFILLGVFYFKK